MSENNPGDDYLFLQMFYPLNEVSKANSFGILVKEYLNGTGKQREGIYYELVGNMNVVWLAEFERMFFAQTLKKKDNQLLPANGGGKKGTRKKRRK